MTDRKPRRVFVGIRLAPAALQWIDLEANYAGVTRSALIRELLAEAVTARQKRGTL